MLFTAEINITSQKGFNMTLDCPKPGISSLKNHLLKEGFTILKEYVSNQGTKNISDMIEIEIEGGNFDNLRMEIIRFLKEKGLIYSEDKFDSADDLHSRFNLKNISIFDKAS